MVHFIKEWRKARGLTQEQLAERMAPHMSDGRFSGSAVSHLESGRVKYNEESLEAAAKALDLRPGDLLNIHPEGFTKTRAKLRPALP